MKMQSATIEVRRARRALRISSKIPRCTDAKGVYMIPTKEIGHILVMGILGRGIGGYRKTFEFNGPAQGERRDFDDGANALWSLYREEAQNFDGALFQSFLANMNGIPTFVSVPPPPYPVFHPSKTTVAVNSL
ncbi:hypothetical protein EDB83DRAFT_2315545 [Lactarius deliciosus]|nr:hypothetical protein EDB83DRAFT_2315545 [Lactarius deliciosus]